MAKNEGKKFEEQFQKSWNKLNNTYMFRLKDAPTMFGGNTGGNNLRFTLNNPCDFFAYQYPYMYAMELKSTHSTSLSFNIWDKKDPFYVNSAMIKKHQIEGLTEAANVHGINAGLVMNFRKTSGDVTYWLDIKKFNGFIATTTKKSINENDIKSIGGFLIPQTIKRTTYDFNIECLITALKPLKDVGDINYGE